MKINFFNSQYLKQQNTLSLMNAFSNANSKKQGNPSMSIKSDSFIPSSQNTQFSTYPSSYLSSSAHLEEIERLATKNASNTFELKAENNVLTFREGCFYNYTTKDGKTVTLFPYPETTSIGVADHITGNYSNSELQELNRLSHFFSALSSKSIFGLRMNYSFSEVKEMLGSLGIEPGKVQINVNGHTNTFYFLEDGTTYPEYQADAEKSAFTTTNWFNYGCTTESVFIVDGKEYCPNEQGYITLPDDAIAVSETITYPPLKVE